MRKDDHTVSLIKTNLMRARRNGKGFVIAKPNSKVRETLRDMHCRVDPYEYEVTLRFRYGFRPGENTAHIVKDLYYYKAKKHADMRILHLSPSQVKACREFGLEVKTHSYKIY